MFTHDNKSKEHKSRAVANSITQKKSRGDQGSGFVDNRPESKSIKNIQRFMNLKNSEKKLVYNLKSQKCNIIQKYHDTADDNDFNTTFSTENDIYHLVPGAREMYGTNDADTPRYCDAVVDGDGNQIFTPSEQFNADCLASAEEIMHEQRIEQAGVFSREYYHKNNFGDTEEGNWNAARATENHVSNRDVKPNVGEAFAIVREEPRDLGGDIMCQYHAAAVVASDGSDRVTLEVFGNPDGGGRNVDGTFRVYNTTPDSNNTFHDEWIGTFPNGITIELEPTGNPNAMDIEDE